MRVTCSCVTTYGERLDGPCIDSVVAAWSDAGAHVVEVCDVAHGHGCEVHCLGDEAAIERGALAAAAIAAKSIDVSVRPAADHVIGSTHSLALSPWDDPSADACVELSGRIGRQAALEIGLPVYLYGRAATRPSRVDVASFSRGGYSALQASIGREAAFEPDMGPAKLGSAGAIAIGVSDPAVSLVLRLADDRLSAAEAVAEALDGRTGGLSFVRTEVAHAEADGPTAIYVTLQDAGRSTPLRRVIELARSEARSQGGSIASARIRGLVPNRLLHEAAASYMRLDPIKPSQLRELVMTEAAVADAGSSSDMRAYLDLIATDEAASGGGSVAALVGALAAALTALVAGLTASHTQSEETGAPMQRLRRQADELQQALLGLVDDEASANEAVASAYGLPRDTADDVDRRREAVQEAMREATHVPSAVVAACVDVLRLVREAAEVGTITTIGDAGIAAHMALASARSAALNVAIRVMSIRDLDEGDRLRRASQGRLADCEAIAEEVLRQIDVRIKAR
jgi:glutamate formiminotransferase/formiminotetrahydrofolate cyclodeaminase